MLCDSRSNNDWLYPANKHNKTNSDLPATDKKGVNPRERPTVPPAEILKKIERNDCSGSIFIINKIKPLVMMIEIKVNAVARTTVEE